MYLKRLITYSLLSLIAIIGFFGNMDNNSNNLFVSSFAAPVSCGTVGSDPATCIPTGTSTTTTAPTAAQTNSNSVDTSTSANKKYSDLIDSINIILAVLSALISPVILFVGWLMSPDWTSGDLFGLRAPMYTLWVTMSNIVYLVYAILLILIALGTMFGKDSFSYKVMLPKLALGILMVPFTWWFVQWTISISTVLTASVISIPMETMNAIEAQKPSKWYSTDATIPKEITMGSGATTSSDCKKQGQCITPKEFMESSAGMYGPLVVYAYSVFKFEKIEVLDPTVDIAKAAIKIVHNSLVSTIMFFVFGLLVIALAVMLITRAMKLWIYAIFSPLFTFQFVAGSGMMGEDKDTFTIKEFVGLAFVPAIVGLSLSFGLILIAAVQGTNQRGTTNATCDLKSDEGCKIIDIMGSAENKIIRKWIPDPAPKAGTGDYITKTTFMWGPTNVNFIGKVTNQIDTTDTTQGPINSLGGGFGTIIIDIIALVFIWVSFMAAKNVSKAVKGAIAPFEEIGNKIGGLAKSMPKYAPILPSSMGGSVAGLQRATNDLAHIPEANANKKYEASGLGKLLHADLIMPPDEVKKLRDAIKDGNIEEIKRIQKAFGNRANNHMTDVPEAIWDEIKNKKGSTYDKLTMNQKELFNDYLSKNPNGPKTEEQKKEILSIMNTIFGGASGTNNAGGSKLDQSGSGGVYTVQGTTINVNGLKLNENADAVSKKIIDTLKGEGVNRFNKLSEDELTQIIKGLGFETDIAKKAAKKVYNSSDIKWKDGTPPGAGTGTTPPPAPAPATGTTPPGATTP